MAITLNVTWYSLVGIYPEGEGGRLFRNICNHQIAWRRFWKTALFVFFTAALSFGRIMPGPFLLYYVCNLMVSTTRSVTEMITRNIYWRAKGGRCVVLTTLTPSFFDCIEMVGASTWRSKGLSRPVMRHLNLLLFTIIEG
jgi:hypothetical protein